MNQKLNVSGDVKYELLYMIKVNVPFSRYCMLFTLFLTVGLAVDPLPKLLPGYFIAKLLLYLWSNNNKW